MYIMTRTN